MKNTHYYKAFVAQTPEEILRSVFKKEEAVLIAISLNNGSDRSKASYVVIYR